MEIFASLVPLVIIFPLVGMLINLFLGKNMGERAVGIVASLAAGLAFGVALIMAVGLRGGGDGAQRGGVPLLPHSGTQPPRHLPKPPHLRAATPPPPTSLCCL